MFFDELEKHANNLAIIDGEQRLDYKTLQKRIDAFKSSLPATRQLVLLKAFNNVNTLVAYLACLQIGHCILLMPEAVSASRQTALTEEFDVNVVIEDLEVLLRHSKALTHLDNAVLLLPTSGSTGDAKQVALSPRNLQANATSICDYLPIENTDKAIVSLPFYYSYGLSIINSHLNHGACLVFTPYSVVNREFWSLLQEEKISCLAGVPHSYQMMLRLKFTQMELPELRYLTLAGGKLPGDKVALIAEWAERTNKHFYVMYGQTEATARMAYLSPEKVLTKSTSIGRAIPGGQFKLLDANGHEIELSHVEGELHYSGDNIMLGYVSGRDAGFDEQPEGWLATGDLAYRDDEGDYFIVGRKKRFVKLFGERFSMDVVEQMLSEQGIEAYCCGTDNKLIIGVKSERFSNELKPFIAKQLRVHPSVVDVIEVDELPVNANGKKDYQKVMQLSEAKQ